MKRIIINRLGKLANYDNKYAIIKYNNKQIGKISLSYLIFFDVFDSIIEFDNIITFPDNFINEENIIYFIENIENILGTAFINNCMKYDILVDIILICDFLQYDINIFECMLLYIHHNLIDKYKWIIMCKLVAKTGKLYFKHIFRYIKITDDDIPNIMLIFKHIDANSKSCYKIYEKLLIYFDNNKEHISRYEFIELVFLKMDVYHNIYIYDYNLSETQKNDLVTKNLNSSIARLYSINMNDAKNRKNVFHIRGEAMYYDIKIVDKLSFGEEMRYIGYLQHTSNDLSKNPSVKICGVKIYTRFDYYFEICVDEAYFTQDWIFVAA